METTSLFYRDIYPLPFMSEIQTDGAREEFSFQGPHWMAHNCQTPALRNSDSLFWSPAGNAVMCTNPLTDIHIYT